jgi:leader peptidase (prepilin peptidase)/N-methyltransferase
LRSLVAVFISAAGIYLTWGFARTAARRRGLRIGSMPATVAAFGALTAGVGACGVAWTLESCVVIAVVTVAAVVDARTGFIFDPLSIGLVLVCLGLAAAGGRLDESLIGAAVVGGSLLLLYAITLRRGIGLGDVKFAAGVGAGFGLARGSLAVAAAFVIGGGVGAWLLATRQVAAGTELRFGPFLALGTYTAVLVSTVWR